MTNESAATLKWLVAQLGFHNTGDAAAIKSAWDEVRTTMLQQAQSGQLIVQAVDWVSDFWLARGAVPVPGIEELAPTWMPPNAIDDWPTFGAEDIVSVFAHAAVASNHDAFTLEVQATSEPVSPEESAVAALERYLGLKSALVPRVFDIPAIQTEHVRCWMAASVGHLLTGALAPPGNPDAVTQELFYRLQIPLHVAQQQGLLDLVGDRHLETLYNVRMLPDRRLQLGRLRTGQGEEWRDHWLALAFDMSARDTLDALQMAAMLLRCRPLVVALELALATRDPPLVTLAVGVARRWVLTLQVMAWLEAALRRTWVDIRPKDLCCLALNAVKPEWPRRVVAVSHRSKDVKPELQQMRAWRSGRFAIDANYAPSWETNIGMIWGLFAATPAITRIRSPSYQESVWCRREVELTDYLLKESDFMSRRWVIDVERPQLTLLDGVVRIWNERERLEGEAPLTRLPEFPPITEVCSPAPMPAWEARMLRASAALRHMHAVLPGATPEGVNTLALYLQGGGALPGTAPTNSPDGWRAYGEIFREASEMSGTAPGELAVRLPSTYGDADREIDLAMGRRIPDLQTGSPSLRDVLVAMEWLRVEYPQFLERKRGDFLAINCQRFSRDVWEHAEEVSLHRGLAAMRSRLLVPLWIIQLADQDVEFWPLVGDVPIFTEHVSAQFAWMVEASYERRDSQRRYPEDSGLTLSPALEAKCRSAGAPPTN